MRVIARLNMGGPSHQAALLSGRRFDPDRYETLLVHGSLAAGEQSLASVAEEEGARMVHLPALGPRLSPHRDSMALAQLVRLMGQFRPAVVHTHTAKAGMLGRSAAILSRGPRPRLVHTFHGHVLEGYFGRAKSSLFRNLERALAVPTDALIGVSQATVDDLVRLRIADPGRFRVIRLGLDLGPFRDVDPSEAAAYRSQLGVSEGEVLCTFVGRFAAIKRLDLLLEATAIARRENSRLRLLIVGDGEDRPALESRAGELGLGGSVIWAGYRRDLAAVWAASDLAVLSSDNEGTPVSLIEAAAAGVPAVATDVGGVRETLDPDGAQLVPPGDAKALADALASMASDPHARRHAGESAQAFATGRFSWRRLIDDIDLLYRELLGA